jgi:hypothetical protein
MMLAFAIDKHTLAAISIIGSSLDVLGALYLAYDLLGGEHGPLRTLTRVVTYGVLFGTGYGLFLGPVFGLAAGLAHGITLGWEYSRASRNAPASGFWVDTAMGAIRAAGFALGGSYLFGAPFGVTFGVLSAAGQAIAYRLGIRPSVDYKPSTRPRISRFLVLAAINRTVGYSVSGYLSSLVAQHANQAIAVGLKTGLAIGIVTATIGPCTPFIEWRVDHLPERRMGVFGVSLILIGFTLQSAQYWATLLDVTVR